ncbi:MAG: glycosyltransferase family 4 protein [Nitrososphaera sp.]
MKIALLVQRFPHGGAERYTEQIARRLHAAGEDVTVVTSQNESKDGYPFPVIRLPSRFSLGEYSLWKGLGQVLQGKFDLVHTNSYGYFHSDYAAYRKRRYGYRLVMTGHGFAGVDLHELKKQGIAEPSKFGPVRPLYDSLVGRKTVLACDRLIALSERDVEYYQSCGVSLNKVTIIPPGIDDSFFLPPTADAANIRSNFDADPLLLSVGELSRVKAHATAIRAMPSIIQQNPKAKLVILGKDRTELESLSMLCRQLGVEKSVVFTGQKSEEEVRNCMHAADLLVHTSLAEGLSTALLESMACGLPFVTTPAGGNGHLARESGAGITIPFQDEKALAAAVTRLLGEGKEASEMKARARAFASDLSWERLFPRIMNVYRSCMEGRGK